jgi:hypothetical protein
MSRATRILSDGIYFGEGPRWRVGRLWKDPDRRRNVGRMLDGLRPRCRRSALQPPSLGHDASTRARWDHAGCGWRHLDRQSGDAGMRADRSRRKGLGSHRHRTTVLRPHAGRRRRAHPVHADGSACERYRPRRPAGRKAVGRRSRGPTRRPSMIVTARGGRRSRLHLNYPHSLETRPVGALRPFRG